MKELTKNQQARLVGRKLPVTKAPKIQAPKTDYDRRDAKEDIQAQLDGLEADDWAMHWDAAEERRRRI